jgi:hypothetical protein
MVIDLFQKSSKNQAPTRGRTIKALRKVKTATATHDFFCCLCENEFQVGTLYKYGGHRKKACLPCIGLERR